MGKRRGTRRKGKRGRKRKKKRKRNQGRTGLFSPAAEDDPFAVQIRGHWIMIYDIPLWIAFWLIVAVVFLGLFFAPLWHELGLLP